MAAYTNAKQNIPLLFKEIIRNHSQTASIRDALRHTVVVHWDVVVSLRSLRDEMREYRRGAEKALRWNTDKGNTK